MYKTKGLLIFIFSLFITLSQHGFAQSLDYSKHVPVDETIKKGVLPNGMTYYIKSTDVVKGAASYYIIQNVGSILENDDQRGLAHFLEHMAFNGTENFPDKGILNTLQRHGATFGKDINAYTGFDETVYSLKQIPVADGMVDTCLMVLRDWSNYLLLTDEEIDAERGVIKEEWRTRQDGRTRIYQTSMPVTFNHSKYADRMPIGLMSVVENFDYKALRDFYHDWYRTDLQAIAIIGDIEVEEIEKKIKEKFSDIPAVEPPRERIVVDIPDHDEMLYSLGMDPEVSSASIDFSIRHKKTTGQNTLGDLKQQLMEIMAVRMLSSRVDEKSREPEATFLRARIGYGSLSRTSTSLHISIYPKENKQKEAFQDVFTELMRAVKFGYIQPEIERMVAQLESIYENVISSKDDMSHGRIEMIMQKNYLENVSMTDVEKEYEMVKQILANITQEELHETMRGLYTDKNRYLNVTGVEGQDNLTEAQAKQIIAAVENQESLAPYTETLSAESLISNVDIKKGTIVNETTKADIDATTFTLSNGVKVHYKYSDKDKDKVLFYAVSDGGTSLLKDEALPSASLLRNLIIMSGLGEFSTTDLRKLLAGKTASVSVNVGEINETMSGGSNTKDVETMLQMAYLYFVKPRFDEEAYQVLESNMSNYLSRRSSSIREQMKDSLTVTLYGKDNPKERLFDQEYVEDISFDKIKAIYKDRFADASDFEFFIIGDVEANQLKPLLEEYLASIPTRGIEENYKDNGAEWISDEIRKEIFIKMEDPKASINIAYRKEMPFTLENEIYAKALGEILQLRVIETIRESEGGAYSPRASAYFQREPKSLVAILIRFDCNPDMTDRLLEIVNAELEKITDGEISEEDLSKVKTSFIKEREQAKDRNSYDMQLLTHYFIDDYDMAVPENFENIVNQMTSGNIQNMAKQTLEQGKSYEIIFKPKE